MRTLWLSLFALTAALAGAQTPTDTVRKFVEAWNRKDIRGAAAMVKGSSANQSALEQVLKSETEWAIFQISDVSEKMSGSGAVVSYKIVITGIKGAPPEHAESLNLANVAGHWLIVAPQRTNVGGSDVLPMVSFMMVSPPTVFADARESARGAACLSNIKQIALAIMMFLTDNDDKLSLTNTNWKSKLDPYMKNSKLFTCPADKAGSTSYALNTKLSGLNFNKIQSPATTVLVYEGKGGVLQFRHKGRAAIAFCDGHAKLVTKEQAKTLNWRP